MPTHTHLIILSKEQRTFLEFVWMQWSMVLEACMHRPNSLAVQSAAGHYVHICTPSETHVAIMPCAPGEPFEFLHAKGHAIPLKFRPKVWGDKWKGGEQKSGGVI